MYQREPSSRVHCATDSIKNITYYLAKISPHILSPERFALHLGTYLVSKYAHIHRAFVSLEKLRWSRITLSGNVDPHPHSFVRDGNDKQTVENLILFMIIEDPVLICSIYHRSPTHMGESSPMTLQSIPRFHLQSDIDHLLLGTTVIDANGRCTQRYDAAGPTDVCMDHPVLTSSMMGSNRSSNGTNPTLNS
ncbi:hypothetical protein EDD22DRAFT_1053438 [Suillus occidentalis]|nr:hypothetical protein EDD22DRAFT_1053438 [Suillus occidentalis]